MNCNWHGFAVLGSKYAHYLLLRDSSEQISIFFCRCDEEEGWHKQFRWYHSRFARFHSPAVYRTMRRLWDRLEKYLEENDKVMFDGLRGA